MGLLSDALISLVILLAYIALGPKLIDASFLVGKMDESAWPHCHVRGFRAYWIAVNSVLEEYVWRWVVFRQCETLPKARHGRPLRGAFFHSAPHRSHCRCILEWTAVACFRPAFHRRSVLVIPCTDDTSRFGRISQHAIVDLASFMVGRFHHRRRTLDLRRNRSSRRNGDRRLLSSGLCRAFSRATNLPTTPADRARC